MVKDYISFGFYRQANMTGCCLSTSFMFFLFLYFIHSLLVYFCLAGFKRKEFRGKLAIAITANFINRNTTAEAKVEEISGVAFIFNQKFFLDLKEETGEKEAQFNFLGAVRCLND